jgi:endo-1,4-beta-D-glucanase Y
VPDPVEAGPYPYAAVWPSSAPKAQDAALLAYYRAWKKAFVRHGCEAGTYQIYSPDAAYPYVAEAQGYGMVVTASMAGLDPGARTVFDGLLTYVLAHPSSVNANLTAAEQDSDCADRNAANSATDGDMDIAYGLLLADRAWGSLGRYDYRALALRRIRALRSGTVHPVSQLMKLGDWSGPENPALFRTSRTSDWNPQYFGAFARATGDGQWWVIQAAHRRAVTRIQTVYSATTGLLPDFVQWSAGEARPARGEVLETEHDGDYGFNACRTPWRIGLDAITSGNAASTAAARKITRWFRSTTGGDPGTVRSGYTLTGRPLGEEADNAFWAPLAVAAMADPQAGPWLDELWNMLAENTVDSEEYYGATIQLQVMLVVTGNWTAL